MAAIAGILRFADGPPVDREARGLLERMRHRAPDGSGMYDAPGLSLGHGAVHVTPESLHERQPIVLDDRWVVAVDGRVDNSDELARALGLDPASRGGITDAGLFALAWRRWREQFWRHLRGDFALAAWDGRERRLTLLRDPVGARPLYVAHTDRLFAFASEPEALLDVPGVSRACDDEGLAYLLADGHEIEDPQRTFYRDVRRVCPGERLQLDAGGRAQRSRYWPIPDSAASTAAPREWVAEFVDTFDAAVRCRLRAVRRPALLLSGGIDSASVLASAHRLRDAGDALALWPLSLVETTEPVSDETSNIRRLHAGGDGQLLPLEGLEASPQFAELLEYAWNAAHPVDNSLLYARLGCLVARAAGRRVVLDGADGDTVMTSTVSRAGELAAAGHLVQGWREAQRASRVNTYLRGVPASRILLQGFAAALQPDWLASWRYRRRARSQRGADAGEWIDAGFARRLQLRERHLAAALAARARRSRSSLAQQRAWTWWNPGFVRALEGTDRTYGRFGIEAWHPWCDQRVIELFLRMPEACLARDGWTKWVAREANAGVLGADIAWYSGKSHLGGALATQVLAASVDRVSALLARAPEVLAGVADRDALARLCRMWDASPAGAIEQEGDAVLQLATLVAWIEGNRLQVG